MQRSKNLFVFLILVVTFASCSKSEMQFDIKKEYEALGEKYNKDVYFNDIRVLKTEELEFKLLANSQIQKLEELNKLIEKILLETDSIRALIELDIGVKKNLIPNANLEDERMYLKEIESDSVLLKANKKRSIQLKIENLENKNKVLQILELSKVKSSFISKNYKIKHAVDLMIDKRQVIDTLYYLSFADKNYSYLNRNIFLKE